MSIRAGLAVIFAGYELAGYGVAAGSLRRDIPYLSCRICGGNCSDSDSITLWINLRQQVLSFYNVHVQCMEGIALRSLAPVADTIDPQLALRGLAMICHGYTIYGPTPRVARYATKFNTGCFACSDPLADDYIEIIEGLNCLAQLHRKCFEPFAEERDRVINVYDRGCIPKVYMLPLGDCRIVIVRLLIRLQSYEEIFRDMWLSRPLLVSDLE